MVAGNLPPDGPAPSSGYATTLPTASIARAPASGASPLSVTFTPTIGGGAVESYDYVFGDGTSVQGSGTPPVIVHQYVGAATRVAYLVVHNAVGSVTSATVSTTIS